ncbi:MAG: hypothetical protein WBD99_17030 [Thermodesulfobacteriota bacterium]
MDFSEFLGSLVLSAVEGLLLCTCAEPCPDDRSGSIQYQDKEVRKKSKINEENPFKDSVLETSGFENSDHWIDSL